MIGSVQPDETTGQLWALLMDLKEIEGSTSGSERREHQGEETSGFSPEPSSPIPTFAGH